MSALSTPDPTDPTHEHDETGPAAPAEPVVVEAEAPAEPEPEPDAPAEPEATEAPAEPDGKRKKRKGAKAKESPPAKPQGPTVEEVVRRVGTTNAEALAYVAAPDPKLSRIGRKVRDNLVPDLPPLAAAGLLGPAALARHLVASSASGRYRDLFALWDLFRAFPEDCKPVLAERSEALQRAQQKLRVATLLGLSGTATRVAEDVERAEGLIWQWLREVLLEALPAVGARPVVASALLAREPSIAVPLPSEPDASWLGEAATARHRAALAEPVEALLAANVHRLPATVETLRLATLHYPDRVEALVDRVDLDAPDVGAYLAWARDHGADERLRSRIRDQVSAASVRAPSDGLALWYRWLNRGVELPLPSTVLGQPLDSYDLTRPETAELAARLRAEGHDLDLQRRLDELAGRNRQLAEKAYEAMVCAGLDVELPQTLLDNPIVKEGTRCPNCEAWTWVRPGHEQRCPRPPAPPRPPKPDPFELAAEAVRDAT
jgi:hypothetical protein